MTDDHASFFVMCGCALAVIAVFVDALDHPTAVAALATAVGFMFVGVTMACGDAARRRKGRRR